MDEIEVKILDIEERKMRETLASFATKVSQDALLTTVTFSNPYNEVTVRLRIIGDVVLFTVKVPVPGGNFKIRKEYETSVGDFEIFKKQLSVLGFEPVMLQEKKRTTYQYKESEIVIDKYPGIPPYMEIEGPKDGIREIIEKLGYSMADTTSVSVYSLFESYNVDARHLVF
jgi:adenylate cyclase class 2